MNKRREVILTGLVAGLLVLGFVLSFYAGVWYWEYIRPPCTCPRPSSPDPWEPFSINY